MTTLILPAWMPPANMRRIHVHWTAGTHYASAYEKTRYHILIQGDGSVVRGNHSIAANAPGSGMKQASHTLNANSGAIGVSLCCMKGAKERPFSSGDHPMTHLQWNAMLTVVAELSLHYNIPLTPQTILTHAEVQPNLGIKQNNKWDITRLSFDASVVGYNMVGQKLRSDVAAERDSFLGVSSSTPETLPNEMKLPRFRVYGVAPSTLNFRDAPAGTKKGQLAEGIVVERLAIWQDWSQVRTPGGYVDWVASAYLRSSGEK
jgi:hypothetical protein